MQEKIADELDRIWHHETRPELVKAGIEPIDDASIGVPAIEAAEVEDGASSGQVGSENAKSFR